MVFRCYSDIKEKICWRLYPCKNHGENITWEQWHVKIPLYIYRTDYEKLLLDYVTGIFPLTDPTNNEIAETFYPCFDTWIGKDDWNRMLKAMKAGLKRNNNRPSKQEKEFYNNFIEWVERELEWADIIVLDSNL